MHFEKIINTAYSFGAAIVVFGAWAKLEHLDFGDTALTVGLLTEVVIFCVYGSMEWRRKPGSPGKQDQAQMPPGGESEVGELTNAMKQTNQILNKIFKAE